MLLKSFKTATILWILFDNFRQYLSGRCSIAAPHGDRSSAHTLSACPSIVLSHSFVRMVHNLIKPSEPDESSCWGWKTEYEKREAQIFECTLK
ncbi:hypothetical protein ACHAWU_004017 [Discostella pseudostelligera]|uniref:Secreted protein n=1 Tax=Discostella pseudostelligera TaxID=259834 RepID=A0ABD3MUR2_9STRA